jgi:hypothetical protein
MERAAKRRLLDETTTVTGLAERRRWSRPARLIALAVGTSVLLAAPPGRAEEPGPASAAPYAATAPEASTLVVKLERLAPGQPVRIATTGNETAEGRLAAVRAGRLLLEGSGLSQRFPDGVPLENVRKAWVRGRGTKTGTIVGAAIGALATAALFGSSVNGVCEVDSCRHEWPKGAAIGLAVGGVAGALTGSLIGGALPQWRDVSGDGAGESGAARRSPIGSASLYLGYGHGFDDFTPGGATGWRLSLAREGGAIGPSLEIRPSLELGHQGLGQRLSLASSGEPFNYRESLTHLGPALAIGPARGVVRPYALASVGFYRWQTVHSISREELDGGDSPTLDHDFLGGSLGGGVRLDTGGPLSLGVEGRWHTNITRGPDMGLGNPARRLSLLSVTGGATFRW